MRIERARQFYGTELISGTLFLTVDVSIRNGLLLLLFRNLLWFSVIIASTLRGLSDECHFNENWIFILYDFESRTRIWGRLNKYVGCVLCDNAVHLLNFIILLCFFLLSSG